MGLRTGARLARETCVDFNLGHDFKASSNETFTYNKKLFHSVSIQYLICIGAEKTADI
jgi:hypothetical protein